MARASLRTRTGWLFVALCTTACGGDYESSEAETETETAALYAGVELSASELNASGLVAIYHPHLPEFPNFYPRPCSGVIVRSFAGQATVLTARHCVTTNGEVAGPLADGSQLRLSPTLSPGAAPPGPPPDAVSAWFVIDKLGALRDVAVVAVLADWQSIADNRIGLYVGDPRSLQSQWFTAYGYGISDPDGNCGVNHSSVGAGIARSGSYFIGTAGYVGSDGQPLEYDFGPISTGGQVIMCGDSGGPDELINGAGRLLLGVHHSGASTEIDSSSTPFDYGLQNRLGGLWLGNANANADAMLGENPSTGTVEMVARGSAQQTSVSYDLSTKLMNMNGRCLSATSSFFPPSLARLAWCDAADPTQLWSVYPNGQIANPRTGKCLSNGSSGVVLAACVVTLNGRSIRPSSTLWKFRAQL